MRPARILLIVVAVAAGGLAAVLAMRGSEAPELEPVQVTQVEQEPRTQVLVANRSMGLGHRIMPGDVAWQDWPQGAIRPEYITIEQVPDAPEQMEGAVARFEIFIGEPVREAKLVRSSQGYLSAVISQGMRAVSISVTPESASGGYIVPNDRVDVVLTRSGSSFSETILANVRVLAIGARLGEVPDAPEAAESPANQRFDTGQVATLELSPAQSESVLNASSAGRLALVLRSISDFAESPSSEQGRSQAIRLIRHGQERSVVSGSFVAEAPEPLEATSPPAPVLQTQQPIGDPVEIELR
ncbi:Flp pilus assembly protein CpaB [Pelagibacterium montanilacus]|uniref:Flp pilus assembly protein CpaB n=1 Tax=Pelagibacterium montanilacus TaxID=2185280 RepID=UPI000F8C6E71|nr:Flp pilus assembly protein CpaB [Pelagibacterium montanilacus]